MSENNTKIETDKKFPQRFSVAKQRIKLEPNCVFVEPQDCIAYAGKPLEIAIVHWDQRHNRQTT